VRVDVLDVTGRSVRVLADYAQEQGTTMLRWDGMTQDGLPAASGLYTIRIVADGSVRTSPLSLSR
jgi:flagellar hook assembly protein FlgD